MKFLLLSISQYSKKFTGEISIVLQSFILSLLMLTVLTPIVSSTMQANLFFERFPYNSLVFAPFTSIQINLSSKNISYDDKQDMMGNIDSKLMMHEEVQSIGASSNSLIELTDGRLAKIYYYNDNLLQNFVKFEPAEKSNVPLLAVISRPEDKNIFKQMQLFDNSTLHNEQYEVEQLVDLSNIQIVALRNSGTVPKISDIFPQNEQLLFLTEDKYINPSDEFLEVSGSRLIYTSCTDVESVTALVETLNTTMADVGRVYTMKELLDAQRQYDFDVNRYEIVMCSVLILLTIFGLGGYMLLNTLQNEKMFSTYYICGMSISVRNKLIMAANSMILFAPMAFAILTYFVTLNAQVTKSHILAALIVLALFCTIFFLSNIMIHLLTTKRIAQFYKGA